MANYLAILSVELQDSLGVSTAHDLFLLVPDTAAVSALISWAGNYFIKLDPITDAAGVQAHITLKFTSAGLKTTPVASSEVEKTGLFNFAQASSLYKQGVDVPAIADATITSGRIDLANTDIVAWRDYVLTAHDGISAVGKFTNDLTSLQDALISFRKHRRAENRRSFEVA
jgi:hypothetical protein